MKPARSMAHKETAIFWMARNVRAATEKNYVLIFFCHSTENLPVNLPVLSIHLPMKAPKRITEAAIAIP